MIAKNARAITELLIAASSASSCAKTGVGWVLLEMSKYDPSWVAGFVKGDLGQFSIESLRNATKYFERQDQKSLIDRFRILIKKLPIVVFVGEGGRLLARGHYADVKKC